MANNQFVARNGIISLNDIQVTGSITATGGINISGSIASASYAQSSSYAVSSSNAISSSYSLSGSYALTSSAATNFVVSNDITASNALITGTINGGITGSMEGTASYALQAQNANTLGGLPSSSFYSASNPAGYTANTGTVTSVTINPGTGISGGGNITTSGTLTITNTAPDQTVTFTGTNISIGGTYPNFTLTGASQYTDAMAKASVSAGGVGNIGLSYNSSTGVFTWTNPGYTSNTGTVTSVTGTGTVSGLSLSGTVTTSGNITLGGSLTLTSGQITTGLGYTPVNKAGDSMAGNLQMGTNQLLFDQSGTRSWSMVASGGTLNINSGDAASSLVLNMAGGVQALNGTSNFASLAINNQLSLVTPGGNGIVGNINAVWGLLKPAGCKIYGDEDFIDGNNSINVYNNAGGGAVTITRKTSGFADSNVLPAPNSSQAVLEIMHAPGTSNGINPGYGGFYFGTGTSPGSQRLLVIFKMKIPVGRSVFYASNSIGSGGTSTWLTPTAGTGQYQDYALIVNSGTSSFSSTHFYYIDGGSATTFYTYLASATVYNITDVATERARAYIANSAMYAPYFYDSNNTAYYLDPAGTSNLYGLTVNQTITGNISGNADTVDGYHASTSILGSNIVVRDTNGYIIGNYINMSDDGNPGSGAGGSITSFITKQGDNYYRSVSPTNASVAIRSVASGDWSIRVRGTDNAYTSGLLQSGAGRPDNATGDTWIFSDSLGSDSNKWGIKHNQLSNLIEFWGNNTMNASVNLSTGDYSGNAASASSVAWTNVSGRPNTIAGLLGSDSIDVNPNTRLGSGYYQQSSTTTANGWPVNGSWYHLHTVTHSNLANYYSMQLAADFFSNTLYYRSTNNSGTTAWVQVIHTGNISGYTTFDGLGSKSSGTGTYTTSGDFRAPIFYDSDNTGYYLNPASTSNLYDLTITGASHKYLYINPGNGYEAMVRYNGGAGSGWYAGKRTAAGINSTSDFHFYSEAVAADVFGISTGGTAVASGDMRAPIFYDSANTSYYLDPNNTSYLYHLILSGNSYFRPQTWIQFDGSYGLYWPNNYGAHFHANDLSSYTQFALRGSKSSYGGIYDQYSGVNGMMYDSAGNGGVYREANGRWYLYHLIDNNCLGVGTSSTNSAYGIYVVKGGYFDGRVDGTIFYDANNTGYYLDPASTSELNKIYYNSNMVSRQIGIGQVGLYNSTRYQAVWSMGEAYLLATDGTTTGNLYGLAWSYPGGQGGASANLASHGLLLLENGGFQGAWGGGSFRTPGDVRGTIFYDWNNTAYYVDPASTSNIVGLTVANTITGNISGNADTVDSQHFAYSNNDNNPTYIWGTNTNGTSFLAARGSMSVNYANSAGSATNATNATYVTINYNNDSNSTYQMLWGSGTAVYGTAGIYCNPSSDTMYTYAYRGNGNVGGTGEATWHPAGIYSGGTNWLYGTVYLNSNTINDAQEVYANGWFRNNTNNTGLYSQNTTQHWSSKDNGYWDASSTTTVSAIRFWTGGHVSALRGYVYANNSNEIGFLNPAGSWIIRCVSTSDTYLTGNFTATGNVTAYSDITFKENIQTVSNGLDKVLALRGVYYNRIEDENKTRKIGVVAQEIRDILPEVVLEDKEGKLSVDYGNIVGVLIEAVKEQQKQIDELKLKLG